MTQSFGGRVKPSKEKTKGKYRVLYPAKKNERGSAGNPAESAPSPSFGYRVQNI